MKREELVDYLEKLYKASSFRDWSYNGLQVEGKREIKRVACAVTASLSAIEKAGEWKADALIVHHGLFWDKTPFRAVGAMACRLKALFEHELSLFAYHLPMDAHPEIGNNWAAALALGWSELEAFGESLGQKIGVKGKVPSIEPEAFILKLESYYGAKVRFAGPLDRPIERVALISGGAHRSFQEAMDAGIDAFITGTADEPTWHEAIESERLFVSVGHSVSEKVGPRALSNFLSGQLPIETCFIEDENPF